MQKEDNVQTQVTVKSEPWATSAPAGFVSIAVGCFCLFAMLSGAVSPTAAPLLGIWLGCGFIIQLVVAFLELKSGNLPGGNAFLFFSAFLMLTGGFEMMFNYMAGLENWPVDGRVDGWAWLALAIVMLCWTPAFFKAPKYLTGLVLALDVALPFLALINLGVVSGDLAKIPAYALLVAGICAILLSAAIIVNSTFEKTIIPMPKPFIK